MSVIGLAGIFQGAAAIISFQIMPDVSFWIWFILSSAYSAIIAGWWWLEYGVQINNRFWLWVGFWFLLIWNCFGYLTVGLSGEQFYFNMVLVHCLASGKI